MASDVFGIKKIYETNTNGAKDWYMDHDPRNDPRTRDFNGNVQSHGNNPVMEIDDHEVRMNVFAESKKAYDDGSMEYNQQKLSNRKYMLLPNDWKNVEITAYIKVSKVIDDDDNGGAHFEWYCRGGPKHCGNGPCEESDCDTCEGTSYHANIYEKKDNEGKVKLEKELEHTSGYYYGDKTKVTDSLKDRWVGYKAVFYSIMKDGKEAVKLEQWLDEGTDNEKEPGNTWGDNPIHEDTDEGDWESEDGNGHCGGSSKQIITWGGPTATFRSDQIEYSLKWASVREIIAPQ